jgi:tripartite ATP-independent transporter DctP family solute receptor
MLACTMLAVPWSPSNAQEIELTFGYSDTPDSHIGQGITRFAELAEAKSDGRLAIKTFPSNQLGGTRDMFENMQLGTISMVAIGSDLLGNSVPEADILTYPYLYRDWDHVFTVVDGPIGDKINDLVIEKTGVRILGTTIHGQRVTFTKGVEINGIEDFSKLKIRVPGAPILVGTFEAFGAHPTPVPWQEVYTSLQTGVVNACETPPALNISQKFYEVTDTMIITDHMLLPFHWLMNNKAYTDLPDWAKTALNEAAAEASEFGKSVALEMHNDALGRLKELGMKVKEIDKAVLKEAVQPLYLELLGKTEFDPSILEDIQNM